MAKKRGRRRRAGAQSDASSVAGQGYAEKQRAGARASQEKQPATGTNTQNFKPIKRHRRKRLKLGEALRKVGLDEQTVAETYVGVVEVLRDQVTREPGRKLLVEVLKECSRALEPPRGSGANPTEPTTIVELHHEMSRPNRDQPDAEEADAL